MENIIGRKTIERGKPHYSGLLFPDDVLGNRKLSRAFLSVARYSPEISDRLCGRFDFYSKGSSESAKSVEVEDVFDFTGGKGEFFGKNAVVLDMASGVGRAVSQFSSRRNMIIGMDKRYKEFPPENRKKGIYIGGDWRALPFTDNAFSGVMSCEGFPRWEKQVNYGAVIEDTTRVCREGSVWRATMRRPLGFLYKNGVDVDEIERRAEITKNLTGNGWDVLIRPGLFIAKLVDK